MNRIIRTIGYLLAVAAGVCVSIGLAQMTVRHWHVSYSIDHEMARSGALYGGLAVVLLLTAGLQAVTAKRPAKLLRRIAAAANPPSRPLVRITVNRWWYSVLILAGARRAR